MGGGPEFSYDWDGKFDTGDVVQTPDGPKEVMYGHYVEGIRYYRMIGGAEYREDSLNDSIS